MSTVTQKTTKPAQAGTVDQYSTPDFAVAAPEANDTATVVDTHIAAQERDV